MYTLVRMCAVCAQTSALRFRTSRCTWRRRFIAFKLTRPREAAAVAICRQASRAVHTLVHGRNGLVPFHGIGSTTATAWAEAACLLLAPDAPSTSIEGVDVFSMSYKAVP